MKDSPSPAEAHRLTCSGGSLVLCLHMRMPPYMQDARHCVPPPQRTDQQPYRARTASMGGA